MNLTPPAPPPYNAKSLYTSDGHIVLEDNGEPYIPPPSNFGTESGRPDLYTTDGTLARVYPAPPEIVDIVAPESMSMEKMHIFEDWLNNRELRPDSEGGGQRRIIRVFPYGTQLPSHSRSDDYKVVIQCDWCGNFGALGCACPGCGHPIG